jgi:hypothetical protein
MATDPTTAIRSALAMLSPSELARVSEALVVARDNPAQAVIAFRNAARYVADKSRGGREIHNVRGNHG